MYDCHKFLKFKVRDRWATVKNIRVCFLCLKIGHTTRECHKKESMTTKTQ